MKLYCWSLFFLVLVFVPFRSNANEPVIWGYGHFAPYLYMQEDGQPRGPYADMVNNIFKHADIEYKAVLAPKRRVRKTINDGSIDFAIGPLTVLDDLNNFYISRAIVAKIYLRAYWIGNQEAVTQATDLNGQSVILITSFDYSGLRDHIENPINNVTLAVNVEDHRRALSALLMKRGKYMLGYHAPVDLIQLEMNIQDLNSYPMIQNEMYLIINKSVKNSRKIMDKLEVSYSAIYSNNINGETDN